MLDYQDELDAVFSEIPNHLLAIDAILDDKVKTMFIRPSSLSFMSHLKKNRGCDVHVLDKSINNSAKYLEHGITSHTTDSDLNSMPAKSFDYAIFDNTLTTFADVKFILNSASNIAEHVIVVIKNLGYWKNRLHFAINGSFSSLDSDPWFQTKHLRMCGSRDFMSMCSGSGLIIERACYITKNGKLGNFYDLSRFPNLSADRFLFIVAQYSNYLSNLEQEKC